MDTDESSQTTQTSVTQPFDLFESRDEPPVQIREIIAILLIVILGDLTIYRSHGYAGFASFLLISPLLILIGRYRSRINLTSCVLAIMLLFVVAKLIWYGTVLSALLGMLLLSAFTYSLVGQFPYLHQLFIHVMLLLPVGIFRLFHYDKMLRQAKSVNHFSSKLLNIIIPLSITILFSIIFVLANPDILSIVWKNSNEFINEIWDYLFQFSLGEFFFWIFIGWTALGLMGQNSSYGNKQSMTYEASGAMQPAPLFEAFRNSLIMVMMLFGGYLIFEFCTLWQREFPKGFYYSGYAHQGAAWLTLALALSTAILSVIFRGQILNDPRLPRLKMMAWIWSLENLLLVVAVYNRLHIYVGFNGMTRMRVIGILGITAVVIGFLLVIWKIRCHYRFTWLIKRQLLVPVLLTYLYAVMPVDIMITKYNVRRILEGDHAPAVQISVHSMSPDALVFLKPLLKCDNKIIREGIQAKIEDYFHSIEAEIAYEQTFGWTAYQGAIHYALSELKNIQNDSVQWDDDKVFNDSTNFDSYVYQWY